MRRKEVAAYFHALGLDPSEARKLFGLLDEDGTGQVGLDAFLDGCIHLRGPASSIDVHLLLSQNKQLAKQLGAFLSAADVPRHTSAGHGGRLGGAADLFWSRSE
mmetsp:Transcript_99563/g.281998  ORF Transcript_99563/g.281998 Transcript_99563/m.281998 type:complete len:104 (-) Transcript_99563:12-323(-)